MKKQKSTAEGVDPTDVIGGIFTARRDLVYGVREVLAGSGFTVEEADLLISLYGSRELGWDDLHCDKDGFVAFTEIERFLVHNPSLLSRRIRKLSAIKPALLEVADAAPGSGLHANAKCVRITDAGVHSVKPVWERYRSLCATLLEGFSQSDLKAHLSVNVAISAEMKKWRAGVSDRFRKRL